MTKPTKWLCTQWRLRSAWASTQSDQSLCCALNGQLRTQGFFMRTAKALIRLGGCPGWSETDGCTLILLVFSCRSSFVRNFKILGSAIKWCSREILNRKRFIQTNTNLNRKDRSYSYILSMMVLQKLTWLHQQPVQGQTSFCHHADLGKRNIWNCETTSLERV